MGFNSTIQLKKKNCKSCGRECFIFSHGNCRQCANFEKAKENAEIGREKTDELNFWFARIAKNVITHCPFCWECKAFIPKEFYRHATAHIFAKSIFDSVKTHPLNYLILSAGCGCHDKTNDWDKFSQMKVWPLAIERIKIIYPLIAERRKNNLPLFILNQII